ncbi:MAG: VRR-NUC domain-containing protein [Candidatus Delongbacteria bacterium]
MANTRAPGSGEPYYLRNFLLLADTVLARDGALFTDEERARLGSVRGLPLPARLLLLRLAGRREGWLRHSRLRYPEIPALDEALDELEAAGWLERAPAAGSPPDELAAGLTHEECLHLLRVAGQPLRGSAQAARRRLQALLREDSHAEGFVQLGLWPADSSLLCALADLDQWVRLRQHGLFRLLELLFFGNRHQDLRQFVVTELGLQRFESVKPVGGRETGGWIHSRAEAEELLEAGARLDRLQEELDELRRELKGWRRGLRLPPGPARRARDLLRASWELAAPAQLAHLPAPRRPQDGAAQLRRTRLRALLAGAALLERLGRPGAAAAWQRMALELGVEGRRRGETWLRLVVNLRHSGRQESAQAACRQALAEQPGPVIRRELEQRLGGARPLREPPVLRWSQLRHPGHAGGRTLLQAESGAALCVEELALTRFAHDGWQGLHVENLLPRALVGLVAWNLIFAPAPGAFLHRFHAAPLDWGRPGFLERRAEEWRRLRTRLLRERHRAGVRERLHSKAGLQNPLVNWSVFQPGTEPGGHDPERWRRGLEVLLEVLPGRPLAELCEGLLREPGELGHGLPDLLLWREGGPDRPLEWQLVEVKGPGDRLFLAQRLWLDWLLERGLPVSLLLIEEEVVPRPGPADSAGA